MAAVLSTRELDAIREQTDRFIAAMDEEYYLHFAGHKDSLDLEPIYAHFAELTSLETANAVGEASTATAAPASSGASPARATSAT